MSRVPDSLQRPLIRAARSPGWRVAGWGFAALLLLGVPSFAQEEPATPVDEPAVTADAGGDESTEPAPETIRRSRRLPTYFSRVVSPEQREQIYAIQLRWQIQIDRLLAQIMALETQRNTEVREVLSPDQQVRVDELVEAARRRREARASDAPPEG